MRFSTELKPSAISGSGSGAGAATNGTASVNGAGGNGAAAGVNGARGRAPPAPASLVGTEKVAWRPTREAELASVGSDGIVRFWDVRARGACVGEVKIGGEGYDMCWRPDGEEIVVSRKVSFEFCVFCVGVQERRGEKRRDEKRRTRVRPIVLSIRAVVMMRLNTS